MPALLLWTLAAIVVGAGLICLALGNKNTLRLWGAILLVAGGTVMCCAAPHLGVIP